MSWRMNSKVNAFRVAQRKLFLTARKYASACNLTHKDREDAEDALADAAVDFTLAAVDYAEVSTIAEVAREPEDDSEPRPGDELDGATE